MSLRNLTVGLKFCLLGFAVVAVTAVLSLVVISSNNRLRDIANQMYEKKLLGIYYVGLAQAGAIYHNRSVYNYVASEGATGAEKEVHEGKLNEYLAKIRTVELTAEEKEVLDQFESFWSIYLAAVERVSPLVSEGRIQEAMTLTTGEISLLFQQADVLFLELAASKALEARQFHEESNEAVARARNNAVIIIVAGVLMLVLLGYFVARSITRPLAELVTSAKKISTGDLTVSIAVNSRDEIGTLAETFHSMSSQIRSLVSQIGEKADLVAASSQELSASSQQTTSAIMETSATMTEIASMAGHVAQGVQQITAASGKAAIAAAEGGKGVLGIAEQMKSITCATEEVGKVIDGLSKKSRDINQITKLITEIADQTNLLALNAAIEAARAGEQGRGFAVVADEVRKLAEQSAKAASEINKLIRDIQAEASAAVGKMGQSGREVTAGTQMVQEVGLSLREISAAVNGLTEKLREISASTGQMVAGVQSVATASEEQSVAAEEVAASSASLSELAEELNVLISQFKF
ncbi:MAG: methyl-accepting chemotaxis protein [Firmicutes bacterium]|nr:methyl-accepting chemotaxis protein [Bacillota bacterium]